MLYITKFIFNTEQHDFLFKISCLLHVEVKVGVGAMAPTSTSGVPS